MKQMIVPIVPVPKGRPRFYCGHAVTPKRTRDYEEQIRKHWTHGMVESNSIYMSMVFCFPIPKSYSKQKQAEMVGKPHTSRGDLDNLQKSVLDALVGTAIKDDCKVCAINAMKMYDKDPCVIVTIATEEEMRDA